MPNRVLLVFSVEKHSDGYDGWPKAVDPGRSDYEIASHVARKVFWKEVIDANQQKDHSDPGETNKAPAAESRKSARQTKFTENTTPDSPNNPRNDWQDLIAEDQRDFNEDLQEKRRDNHLTSDYSDKNVIELLAKMTKVKAENEAKLPCYVIIDVAFFVSSDGMKEEIERTLAPFLDRLSRAKPPRQVTLVSTIREYQLEERFRDALASMIRRFVPLCRNDVDPWDELYNLIKMSENTFRCQGIMQEALGAHCDPNDNIQTHLRVPFATHPNSHPPQAWQDFNYPAHPIDPPNVLLFDPDEMSSPLVLRGIKISQLVISPNARNGSKRVPRRSDDDSIEPVRKAFRFPILIWNCEIGTMRMYDTEFETSVIIRDSQFVGGVEIKNCNFGGVLDFRSCDFHEDCDIEYCSFHERLPWFRKAHFTYRFEFRRNIGPDAREAGYAPTLMFERSTFQARTRIDMPAQRARLAFYACRFEQSDYTEVNWLRFPGDEYAAVETYRDFYYWTTRRSILKAFYEHLGVGDSLPGVEHSSIEVEYPRLENTLKRMRRFYDRRKTAKDEDISNELDIYLRVTGCSIDGRMVIREYPEYRPTFPYVSRAGLMVILDSSTISGVVNLAAVRLRSLSALRTVFNNGGLQLNRLLHRPMLWFSLYPRPITLLLWKLPEEQTARLKKFVTKWLPWVRSVDLWSEEEDIIKEEKAESLIEGPFLKRLSLRVVKYRRWLRTNAEFLGIVHDELIAAGRSSFRFADVWKFRSEILVPQKIVHANETESRREKQIARTRFREHLYNRISQQYDDLRVAFRNTPDADESEDFCHYKAQKYRHAALVARIPNRVRHLVGTIFIVSFLLLLDLVGSLLAGKEWALSRYIPGTKDLSVATMENGVSPLPATWYNCFFPSKPFLFAYAYQDWVFVALCLLVSFLLLRREQFRSKWLVALRHGFARQIYEGLLGYGVYPARPLLSSLVLIVLFAHAYWIIPVATNLLAANEYIPIEWADRGDILMPGGNPVLGLNETSPRIFQKPLQALADCLYFSVVTFTTLGYGDFQAEGSLRVIAMSEALTGALMIALITVAVARQILRT